MGMYTELVLSCNIHNDAEVVHILKYMCNGETSSSPPQSLPNHPFFESGRWDWMFTCNSHYHVPRSHSSIEYNDISKLWTLIVRCDFKNYDDEIEKFVDWIAPHVYTYGKERCCIGYSLYEEDEEPTILYVKDNGRDD